MFFRKKFESLELSKLKEKVDCLWGVNIGERLHSLEISSDLLLYDYILKRREKTIARLQKSVSMGVPVRVGFFVIFDSIFPSAPVYQKMLEDKLFTPSIVVIPDVQRGESHMHSQMQKTILELSRCYANVATSYDQKENKWIDFSNSFDMVFFANPYDTMTDSYYQIRYAAESGVLPLYTTYGYVISNFYEKHLTEETSFKLLWKYFAETKSAHEHLLRAGINSVETGYCKMDALAYSVPIERTRKRIIIAPHHTVENWEDGVNLSRFLQFSDFFLELPSLYPEIDFVFRPHPLLLVNLSKDTVWGEEKTSSYFEKLSHNANLKYDDTAEYFSTFVNSDALIHDCGSFMAEYLFTGHPVCYLLKENNFLQTQLSDFAQECIEHHYKGFCTEDIIRFIDNVVIAGQDSMKKDRLTFVNDKLKMNYPNVSEIIIDNIKTALQCN